MVRALEEKKGEQIVLMDIHEIAVFADYFILCNGTSNRMIESLVESVSEAAHKQFHLEVKVEGLPDDGWMVVDLGDVVIHLFSPDQREYYRLEQLWDKGKVLLRLQ
ncbi:MULTISPECIES: ribosome silencing factor [Anaerolinea]|jgi:ribosome-associated protein|uniref:ribosome silencing factor n=1 Tax=Anaerolinea TaxID=233189 RepID=UPI00262BB1B3|nr:ribosome silencing factor [Anaerolinea thermophila]